MTDVLVVNMPILDGFGFLRELRKMPRGTQPIVMLCTTENDVAHMARAKHAGANTFLLKPFDLAVVHAKCQEVGIG